jgi:hypothetical protein
LRWSFRISACQNRRDAAIPAIAMMRGSNGERRPLATEEGSRDRAFRLD